MNRPAGRWDAWLFALPGVKLVLHLITANGYGYFRDELYYLACARHLDFGYVDHPPLSVLLLKLWTAVFGSSLFALRVLPALAGAGSVLLVGLLARRMGGGRLAQQIAMLAALSAPVILALDSFYSMNAWEILLWALAAYVFAGILLAEKPALGSWIGLGAVLGFGLENKISVLWLGAGIAAGLLLTGRRRLLATPGPWIAGILAGALFLPYVLWNLAHDLAAVEFIRNATAHKMVRISALEFAGEQAKAMGLGALLLALAGVLWLLFAERARPFRPLGVAFAAVWLFLAFSGTSRASYPAAAYSWVLAAGGVALSEISSAKLRRGLAGLLAVVLVAFGALAAPFVIPILPVESFIRYQAALGQKPGTEEKKTMGALPQLWADRQGWPEIVDTFADAWDSLSPAERRDTALFASDYGVAGAVDLLGPARGLPPAVSGHNSYWIWGPPPSSTQVLLVHSDDEAELRELFTSVIHFRRLGCGHCMPYESESSVWICRGPKRPWAELWAGAKNFS
jgi:Dolichyl-phosphate-mannose-protein mannosyltransferase